MRLLLPALLWTIACVTPAWANLQVSTVSPAANSISVDRSAPVVATFSAPIDPTTVTPASFNVFGLWSGVAVGDIEVGSDGLSITFTPDRPFSAGERVTVSISRSVEAADGTPMSRGYAWHFMVATRAATLTPEETTRISVRQKSEGWIQTYGAYAGDFNEDGYTDLAVPNERSNDFRLFLNDGSGFYRRFDIYPIPSGSRPSVNEGADFDRDGHMDFVVGNSTGSTVGLFMGDGQGALVAKSSFPVGSGVRGLAVLDLNGDNYPDVATASRQSSEVATLLNDGTGSFLPANIFATPATGETAAAAADLNEDGIMDLLVGSYFSSEMVVLLGDGDGALKYHDVFRAGGSVWMIAAGDVNRDGHADVVSANADDSSVSVLLGNGKGDLSAPSVYGSDVFTIAIDLGDLDGDGDLDMVSSNFGNSNVGNGSGSWIVYENDGSGLFTMRKIYPAGSAGSCVVLHDRDNDGTLDMTAIDELQDELVLFTNEATSVSTEWEMPLSDFGISLYPNPTRGAVTVSFATPTTGTVRLEIYDLVGRRLATALDAVMSPGTHVIPMNDRFETLPAGSYFVSLSADGRRTLSRIVKTP